MNASIAIRYVNDCRRARPGHARGGRALHAHSCDQIEIITSGRCTAHLDDRERELRSGDILLLPAHCRHGFHYPHRCAWLSVKADLTLALDHPMAFSCTRRDHALIDACLACLPDEGDRIAERVPPAFAHAVLALVIHLLPPPTSDDEPPLIRAIRGHIDGAAGRPCTVAAIAHALGYTPGHCNQAWRAHTGTGLKQAIDASRWRHAAELLQHSDLDLTGIAEHLDFPDLFAFSRFVKRACGMSPSAWRARHAS